MFPISIEGEFDLGPLDADGARTVLDGIQLALADAGGAAFTRTPVGITFSGMLFIPNWQPLIMVGRSEVVLTPGAVANLRYRFSLVPAVLYSLVVIALISIISFRSAPIETAIFALVALLFLVGGSHVLRSVQLTAILKRGAEIDRSSA